MKLILDIDDVLLDWSSAFDNYIRDFYDYKGQNVRYSNKTLPELLEIPLEEVKKIIHQYNTSQQFSNLTYYEDSYILNRRIDSFDNIEKQFI